MPFVKATTQVVSLMGMVVFVQFHVEMFKDTMPVGKKLVVNLLKTAMLLALIVQPEQNMVLAFVLQLLILHKANVLGIITNVGK